MGYTNSSLISYTQLSPNHSGQRTHSIDRITPHCVVGQLSCESICGCFTSPSREASCNYGIGTDGRISLCVEEKNRSWCSSSNANDQRAITIECASDTTEPCVPYGYSVTDGILEIIPEEAKVVKRIFSSLLGGKGTDAIAKELNAEHIPARKGNHWSPATIRGIIANEKYTGDCIFQKTYTDDNFNRHTNDGVLDQYYMANHHEAIISHEDFEAAAALIEQRAAEKGIDKGNPKYQQRYAFSGKIICHECGNTFRRRIHSSTYGKYAAWCCNTHIEDTNKCSMLFIRDEDIKVAFATVLNKLIYGHNLVLKPYLQASKHNSNDANILRIQQLESLLEQNAEQRETLHKLMGQGYIDQILYTQENNALLSQADGYRQDIEVLNQFMSGSSTRIYETERLLHFCEHEDMLKEYDENLFEIFVDHIEVYSRNEIGFVMKCGLTLKEMI